MADSPSTTLINPTETYFLVGSVQVVVALHDHLVHLLHQIGWENGSEGLEVLSAESVGVPQSFLLRMRTSLPLAELGVEGFHDSLEGVSDACGVVGIFVLVIGVGVGVGVAGGGDGGDGGGRGWFGRRDGRGGCG